MYCPYCGADLLPAAHSEYRCERSGALFSQHLSARLHTTFAGPSATESTVPASASPSHWFCPGCGVPMVQVAGSTCCPKCARSLNPFIYEIVEINPHTVA